jgi:hypothetical protein
VRPLKNRLLVVLFVALTMAACRAQKAPARWSEDKANVRYTDRPRLVRANFIASDSINQLEITQTCLPWESWQGPYVLTQPTIWFHEVFRQDDTPYLQRVDLIRKSTGRGTPSAATANPQ